LSYYTSCLVQNWYFVGKISEYLTNRESSSILEAGAGTGFLAIYFSSLGHKVFAVDIDTSFIEEVNSFLRSDISVIQDDIRIDSNIYSQHYDLVYNIGVMEHFRDEEIVGIFRNFRISADILIFAVPNFKIPFSFGDERYLSKWHWRKLLGEAQWRIKETFSYNRYGLRNYLTGFVCKCER